MLRQPSFLPWSVILTGTRHFSITTAKWLLSFALLSSRLLPSHSEALFQHCQCITADSSATKKVFLTSDKARGKWTNIDRPHRPLPSAEVLIWAQHSVTKLSQPLSILHWLLFHQCYVYFLQRYALDISKRALHDLICHMISQCFLWSYLLLQTWSLRLITWSFREPIRALLPSFTLSNFEQTSPRPCNHS